MAKTNTPRHVRTRIAPSPTGDDLHIGSVYMGLFNYVFAKKHKGEFVVRIEDTDRERFVQGAETRMMKSLNWMGIHADEDVQKGGAYAPYRQSERLAIYMKYAKELVQKKHAYYCFCTSERLTRLREAQSKKHLPTMYDGLCKSLIGEKAQELAKTQKYVIRLLVPDEGTTSFTDLVRGEILFENKLLDDQVLIKSDGYPTYHLAVVVDDYLMQISHIIRGEEWISSTPKHILLYQMLDWDAPMYAHLPLLRNPDKSKLSKRKNPVWVSWYEKQGFLPEAIVNYLGTLTWSMPKGADLFTLDEMIRDFDLQHIKTTAPVFDIVKLKWFNKQYLMQKTPQEFAKLAKKYSLYHTHSEFDSLLAQITELIRPRISTLTEFDPMVGFLFEKVNTFERTLKKDLIKLLTDVLTSSEWNKVHIEQAVRKLAESEKIKPKDLFMELRVAITGKSVGLPLLESLEILGKEVTLQRLRSLH